VQSRAVRC